MVELCGRAPEHAAREGSRNEGFGPNLYMRDKKWWVDTYGAHGNGIWALLQVANRDEKAGIPENAQNLTPVKK